MNKYGSKAQEKVGSTLKEFKHGDLNDSHGNKVTKREQAIAIGLSAARADGGKAPKK